MATTTATTYDDNTSFPVIDLTNNSDDNVSDILDIFDTNITLSSNEDLFNFSQNEEEEEQNLEVLKSSKNQNYVQEEKQNQNFSRKQNRKKCLTCTDAAILTGPEMYDKNITNQQRIQYINKRKSERRTYFQYEKKLEGYYKKLERAFKDKKED